jgi:hypothetical protein
MNSQSDTVTSLDAASSALTATLPREIICIILEHNLEARAQSLVDMDVVEIFSPQYPILPLVMTSRWFCQATIPLLYKHVNLINNRAARGFAFQPNVHSYSHVKTLDIGGVFGSFRGALETLAG